MVAHRGDFPLPDYLAHNLDRTPHALFSVRFHAHDLWPEVDGAEQHDLYLDLFRDYLRPINEEDQR